MEIATDFILQRQMAIELFSSLYTRAHRSLLVRSLARRACSSLARFSDVLPYLIPERRYVGIQNIRLDQITGSVGRATDFDADFRPLKAHMRDRWVSNFLHMQSGSSEAILVYQVGDRYYVEDGHHRVSVARASGRTFIEAEVWEYCLQSAAPFAEAPALRLSESWQPVFPSKAPACACPEAA